MKDSKNKVSIYKTVKAPTILRNIRDNISSYSRGYNPPALFKKIKAVAKKVGAKTVYVVLILYYATFDKKLPVKDRLMVVAALGYFILPLDFLPDAMPGGFSDDAAALLYVVKHIWSNLSEETFLKAKARLHEWFGDINAEEITV